MIVVRVPASTSNLGAGFDCLGLALDLWLEVRVRSGTAPPQYAGTLASLDPHHNYLTRLAGDVAARGLCLEATSAIPISRGLGSSAAAIVAGLVLQHLLHDEPVEHERIFRMAAAEEGHPDNAGPAVYGGLILFTHRAERLTLHPALGIALAVPETEVNTKAARTVLPTTLPRETAVAQASAAAALVLGLTNGTGELIAFGMEDRIATPRRHHLIPGYTAAVEAGRASGALGVTISGAGPTIVAVAQREQTQAVAVAMAEALTRAGNRAEPLAPAVSSTGVTYERTPANGP